MRYTEISSRVVQETHGVDSGITLEKLYGGNYPDRDEIFWDYVGRSDLDKPLAVESMPHYKLKILLLGQYRAEHPGELVDLLDSDQKRVLRRHLRDVDLSNNIIVISGDRVVDGNHRALAAVLSGKPIKYVDLADLDGSEINEVLDTGTAGVSWDTSDPEQVTANFTASNGVNYVLYIVAPYIGPDEMSPGDFFSTDLPESVYDSARFVEFSVESDIPYASGKKGVEGTGSAPEVFGVVVNSLLKYIKKYKPSMLYFQAAEGNRRRLYSSIARRVLGVTPGWAVKQLDDGQFVIYNVALLKKHGVSEGTGGGLDEAWVSEGNHRIMAAAALGWDSLPVELKYFDGGERIKSGPLYPGKIGLGSAQGVAETTALKLSPSSEKAKAWIEKVYAQFPGTWQNNHVMLWGEGEGQQMAMFELVPSSSKRDAVDVKWFQAYPLRQGVGSRGMRILQGLAQEDGITLTLYPWDKGQISQAKLIKFYKSHGFKPLLKGTKTGNMIWKPEGVTENNSNKKSFQLQFSSTMLKESEIPRYVKKYCDLNHIDKPHGKFISNIKRLSKVNESTEHSEIKSFIRMIQGVDSPRTIKVGDEFSVLEFEIIFAYKEINGRGFTTPKEVAAIKLHPDGKINYIEFTDGDRYPRLTPAVYQGKPIVYAAYFTNEKHAQQALTAIILKVPDGWDLDISDIKRGMAEDTVDEMALQTYKTMGDFTKPGPFTGADKRLVPHAKNIEKATKFFERTPYDFRLFFSNLRGTGKYSEHGPMTHDQLRQVFGQDAEEIIGGSGDAITVVFVGNRGDAKVMLTPWMMAHRFGHAIQAGTRSNRGWSAWGEAEAHFFRTINGLLEEHYNKIPATKPPGRNILFQLTPEYNALFNAIGTQRSSKSGQIRRPYEFLYELFAQYLGTGRVTLNPLPTNLGYGRKVFGNPTKYMNIKREYMDLDARQRESDMLAADMQMLFDDVLGSSVGKIFVM